MEERNGKSCFSGALSPEFAETGVVFSAVRSGCLLVSLFSPSLAHQTPGTPHISFLFPFHKCACHSPMGYLRITQNNIVMTHAHKTVDTGSFRRRGLFYL